MGRFTVRRSQRDTDAPIQCASITLAPAWMRKMSSARTGPVYPGVNGAAAAAERDLAKSKPVVACMPTMVAPRPTKFTAKPVDSWRTTSVRGGTRSSWSTALRSLSPSLPMPRDQKVVK